MDISIISINYNNSILTKGFIESLLKVIPKTLDYEIIIVDKCSVIGDYTNLKSIITSLNSEKILLKRSKINLGFGGGNMFGNQYANGTYLAFINNDVIFTEDNFSSLIDFCERNKSCGVVTPQQYNIKNKPTTNFDHFYSLRKEFFGRRFLEKTSRKPNRKAMKYTSNLQVDFVQGCFMFFNRKAFNIVGGFDTNIFLYYEEMDICHRLKKNDYKSWLCPETSFKHIHGASSKKNIIIKLELIISRMYVLRKNHSIIKYLIIKHWYIIKYLFKGFINYNYLKFVPMLIFGNYLSYSLKHKQVIIEAND